MNLTAKILLTVYYGGRLATPIARKVSKSLVSRVMTSPFETVNTNKKGDILGYTTPKGHFKANQTHEDAQYNSTKKYTVLSQECYDTFTDPRNVPIFFRVKDAARTWSNLTDKQRLEVNLERYAEGNTYSYELV